MNFLTSGEFAVLKSLVTHRVSPLSQDKLMNLARGRDFYSALERSIDVDKCRCLRSHGLENGRSRPTRSNIQTSNGFRLCVFGQMVVQSV